MSIGTTANYGRVMDFTKNPIARGITSFVDTGNLIIQRRRTPCSKHVVWPKHYLQVRIFPCRNTSTSTREFSYRWPAEGIDIIPDNPSSTAFAEHTPIELGRTLSAVLNKRRKPILPLRNSGKAKNPDAVLPDEHLVQVEESVGNLPGLSSKSQEPKSPYRTELLHLLRALLRQCTYLPDPSARSYLHSHVLSRFRGNPKKHTPSTRKASLSQLKTARKALIYLQRANAGHTQHLTKVLEMTYGRVGKRRHELLGPIKIPTKTNTTTEGQHILTSQTSSDIANITPQLAALIRSQLKRKDTVFPRQSLKSLHPKIPAQNAWSRPMPLKRVRNIKKRWYAEALDRTMPPLPLPERNRLRSLASGEALWSGPIPRRKGRQLKAADDAGLRSHMTKKGGISRPHALTPRFMRRLWGKLLAQCPVLVEDERKKEGLHVLWSDVQKEREIGVVPATGGMMKMFEGVDARGRIMR